MPDEHFSQEFHIDFVIVADKSLFPLSSDYTGRISDVNQYIDSLRSMNRNGDYSFGNNHGKVECIVFHRVKGPGELASPISFSASEFVERNRPLKIKRNIEQSVLEKIE